MTTLAPTSEVELCSVVAEACAASAPLEIAGGGTRLGLGRPVQADRTISMTGYSGITLFEPGALTLVAKAGTPMSEIEATLASEKQMLAFEPMDHRALLGTKGEPTIGGVAATAASGPRRLQRGACRDAMIGVRLVDGQGQAISNGGRVMKNVTGYDLVKLMAGSYGTLGVLSEISFKLVPAPEETVTLKADGLTMAQAVQAFSTALASPCEPTGAAFLPTDSKTGTAHLRIEGLPQSVAHRVKGLLDLLSGQADWSTSNATESADLWKRIRDVQDFSGSDAPVWRVSVKPTDGPVLTEKLQSAGDLSYVVDWAGGLLWISANGIDPGDPEALQKIHATIQYETSALGGHAMLVRAPVPTRAALDVFQAEHPVTQKISEGLRAKFDPHGILNPGRMRA